MDAYTNFGFGRVLVRPEPPDSGTALQLLAGQAAKMPAVPFNATAWPTTEYPEPVNAEIVRVTAIVGDNLTIVRAQEGTTAQAILEGFAFAQSITKKTIDDLRNASNLNAGTIDPARFPPTLTAALQQWPIGSVFLNVTSTSPATLLGYGTWVAFGTGRMLVGFDPGDPLFNSVELTGGTKTHTLTKAELPSHTHLQNAHKHTTNETAHTHVQRNHTHSVTDPGHFHNYAHALGGGDVVPGSSGPDWLDAEESIPTTTKTTGIGIGGQVADMDPALTGLTLNDFVAVNQNEGGGAAHNNLPPYVTVFMWKRTA